MSEVHSKPLARAADNSRSISRAKANSHSPLAAGSAWPPASGRGRAPARFILCVNAGSSSIKLALFRGRPLRRHWTVKVERIGLADPIMIDAGEEVRAVGEHRISACDHASAFRKILEQLGTRISLQAIEAIGHRVVHGGAHYSKPEIITEALLKELHGLESFDPEHMPAEVRLIQMARKQWPALPQVACFDTAFHHGMPRVARLLPIPRRYFEAGVRRYGFHGLSYSYVMSELRRRAGDSAARGRVIVAHLGNGASMAAVKGGRCLDTTMAFTPAAGLPMSTRAGDLDPGLPGYLAKTEGMTAEMFNEMVNKRCGLLGISEISSDIRDLLALEETNQHAADAVECFVYHAAKFAGGLVTVLGGLDTLVFCGGIGEHSPEIRQRICARLGFLGVSLAREANERGAGIISEPGSAVTVQVIPTDEEIYIAQVVRRHLGTASKSINQRTAKSYE